MKFFVVLAALVVGVIGQSFTINTPTNVVQCQPIQLTWTGNSGEVFLSIHDGNNPDSAALVDLGTQTGNSLTWVANFPQGTVLSLALRDQTGATVQSAPFTVNAGSSDACLTSSSGAQSSTAASSTVSETAGSTTAASTTATSPVSSATTSVAESTSRSTFVTSSRASTSASGSATTSAAQTSESASDGASRIAGAGILALAVPALISYMV